jgi:hypothetical protein
MAGAGGAGGFAAAAAVAGEGIGVGLAGVGGGTLFVTGEAETVAGLFAVDGVTDAAGLGEAAADGLFVAEESAGFGSGGKLAAAVGGAFVVSVEAGVGEFVAEDATGAVVVSGGVAGAGAWVGADAGGRVATGAVLVSAREIRTAKIAANARTAH